MKNTYLLFVFHNSTCLKHKKYSARDIEKSCKRDINFMYLLEGFPAPDHATLARFQSLHLAECSESILAQMSEILYELGEISGVRMLVMKVKRIIFFWKRTDSLHSSNLQIMKYPKRENTNRISAGWRTWNI